MARPLAPEILRVIASPYTVSLINLDAYLQAAGPHEIQEWAETHPCQIRALVKETVNSLEVCPYGLPVIERLGVAAQLKDEMLSQQPALLDTLIRSALHDDLNFDRFSPVLVALLSTPLPPAFPQPAKLVVFFLKCLDKAIQDPSIDTMRALYVLVANGYSHLALQMSENQNFNFAKLMAGLLVEKGNANINWFLVYCLATLGHMHLACDAKVSLWAVRELFRGTKGASLLGMIINIVYALASPDKQVDWREKVQVVRMATVAANAVSNAVKTSGVSSSDAASLKRILEKTMALDDDRVASEMLQFVSALLLMAPLAPLDATIQQLVRKNRKEETSSMFLPLISIKFFAQAVHVDLMGDMLRSVLKCASRSSKATSPSILFLRDRIEFVQQLNKAVPDSPKLQQSVLEALSMDSVRTLVEEFARNDVREPTATGACGDGESCQWAIADLINQLQKALCSFLLRCTIYSQAVHAATIPPSLPDSLMEKLTRICSVRHECPFENELKTKTRSHNLLPLIETSASPEAQIPSHNWQRSLRDGLEQEAGRHHRFIVSAVGKVCRDLESRCETIDEPLRVEQENSRRLQNELDDLRASNDRWKESGLILAGKLEAAEKDVHQKQAMLVQKLQVIERQNGMIDEFVREKGLWEHHRESCENTQGEFRGTVERIRLEMEAANQDHVRKASELNKELNMKHAQQIAKIKNDHANELDEMNLIHEAEVDDLKCELSLLKGEHERQIRNRRREIAVLKRKLGEFRVIRDKREEEEQQIGRQLGLTSGAKPDLAGLSDEDKASLDALSDSSSAQRVTAPARRRWIDGENDHSDNRHTKRAKTTHSSSPSTFQQNSPLPLKPHRNTATAQFEPNAAQEPPVSRAGTDYGMAPILTSTPNNDDLGPLNNMRDMQWQTSPLRSTITQTSDVGDDDIYDGIYDNDLYDDMDEEDVILGNAAGAPRDGTTNQ